MNWKKLRSPARTTFKNPKISKSQTTISKDFIGTNDNGIMQYTTDIKKYLLSFSGRLCKMFFPEFC